MLNLESIENYSLEEIEKEIDTELRNKLLDARKNILFSLNTNKIASEVIICNPNASIVTLRELLQVAYFKHTSYFLFPGDLCRVLPQILDEESSSLKTCDISGNYIMPGEVYVVYNPIIENVSRDEVYQLKREIHVKTKYYENLPKNLKDLEILLRKLQIECVEIKEKSEKKR